MVITENKSYVGFLSIVVGVIGAIIAFSALFVPFPQPYYVVGAFLQLITALYFRLFFFVALEIILISGHASKLLGIGTILQIALPILLCFQLLFYYFFSGQEDKFPTIIGIIGIALISVGFTVKFQPIFLIGSLSISTYAYYNLKNSNNISLLWLILNLMFATTALIRIIKNIS